MKSGKFSIADAKQIDLVGYLASLNFQPVKIRNNDYWYLSPLRDEKEPSFKVNRKLNLWYDHGMGKGGDMIDFGEIFHRCTVKELLERLNDDKKFIVPFHQPPAGEKKESLGEGKITVMDSREIASHSLKEYLEERNIPLAIANRFCCEVDFQLYNKKHTAIGFKNDAGGYELRNGYFKGSSSPKSVTSIGGDPSVGLSVFEGFFNFLSFHAQVLKSRNLFGEMSEGQQDFLILNSLAFFERSRGLMEKHDRIHLFLDRDDSGLKNMKQALEWSEKYVDESVRYKQYKDLNEFLIAYKESAQKQSRGLRP